MGTEADAIGLASELASFESGYTTDQPTGTPAEPVKQEAVATPIVVVNPIKELTDRLDKLQKGHDTLAGSFGGVQKTHKELQQALAAKESATRIMTDAPQAQVPFDAKAFEETIRNQMLGQTNAVRTEIINSALDAVSPGWQEEVRTPAFATWAAAQSDAVKALIDSDKVGDAAKMLRMYDASKQAPPAPQQTNTTARTSRLAAAVNPRGAGGHAPSKTDADEMNAGYSGSS